MFEDSHTFDRPTWLVFSNHPTFQVSDRSSKISRASLATTQLSDRQLYPRIDRTRPLTAHFNFHRSFTLDARKFL